MNYVKAKKQYGQNFLKNKEILNIIASSISVNSKDLIVEIGPGMGALTSYLYKKNSFLLCYEIDLQMKEYLEKFNTDRSKIIYGDFLKQNVLSDSCLYDYQDAFVVANIPYYITSPIIEKLLELSIFSEIVLLIQKEVAQRIVANAHTKDYNAFTLFIDYFYDSKIICTVDRNDFFPVPNVDSAVVKLIKKKNAPVRDQEFYFQFIKKAFTNKRKTLKNNMKDFDWNIIKAILERLGYKENIRAEEISREDFYKIVVEYKKIEQ